MRLVIGTRAGPTNSPTRLGNRPGDDEHVSGMPLRRIIVALRLVERYRLQKNRADDRAFAVVGRAREQSGSRMFRVKSPQDFGSAIVFLLIGLAGLYFGKDLTYGTASRMGPGYFPYLLSWLIIAVGVGVV